MSSVPNLLLELVELFLHVLHVTPDLGEVLFDSVLQLWHNFVGDIGGVRLDNDVVLWAVVDGDGLRL